MKAVFADTSFFLALLAPGEPDHLRATEFLKSLKRPMVTTEYVLVELGNTLSRGVGRQLLANAIRQIQSDKAMRIVWADARLFEEGLRLFAVRPDKEWSLTDCVSFDVMGQLGLTEALTLDHHFAQAGFTVLPALAT